ncbi:hypothetical protein NDU88_000618 [Pleurodeles waltl]|uniref:Receptor ligand binding region domain-containing protein n=1 Tax=Pleurodeles waltl TaxID=8319 RepID=A0AAV7KMJ7_PLEWA|nr:hypothetical protein NDU88_000618 [Pleurodeles waltl]
MYLHLALHGTRRPPEPLTVCPCCPVAERRGGPRQTDIRDRGPCPEAERQSREAARRVAADPPAQNRLEREISYFATSPLLSNRRLFPSFFRTIPSDDFQSSGLAQLLIHFGWTWVGLLAEESDYGQQGIQILKQELHLAGACVAFSENIVLSRADRNAFHIVQVIKKSTASAIVIFSLDSEMVPIIEEIMRQNVTGKIWIASESWSTSSFLSDKKYSAFLNGTIGFTIHSGKMPGFEDFLFSVLPLKFPDDVLLREFWKEAFDCQWLDQKDNIGTWNNETRLCTGAEKLNRVLTDYTDVLRYVHNVHFETASGDPVHFDRNGNPLAQYDIINWQMNEEGTITHVKVGSYDSSAAEGEFLHINAGGIVWPTKSRQVRSA